MKKEITIKIKLGSVIGKTMTVEDNSYARDLTNGTNNVRVYGKRMIIIGEPKAKQVHDEWELKHWGPRYATMVPVVSPLSGIVYEVMYNEESII